MAATSDSEIRVLLVEDSATDAGLVQEMLGAPDGFELTVVEQLNEACSALERDRFDAVLLDLMLPDSSGLATLSRVQDRAPDVPIVVLSGFGSDDALFAREVVRGGAQDFLAKWAMSPPQMGRAIVHAIERKRLEQRRVRYAREDELTGLANRLLLEERFERAVARSERQDRHLAVLALQLDGLVKVCEDTDADFRDRLLRAAARRLESALRRADTLARTRGTGFVALLEGLAQPSAAPAVARRIRAVMASPLHLDKHQIRLGASIGIAVHPEHGRSLDELIALAETTMFEVAQDGGNAFRLAAPPLHDTVSSRRSRPADACSTAIQKTPATGGTAQRSGGGRWSDGPAGAGDRPR